MVTMFFFNLSSEPEFKSPPTVSVPVLALKLNAVAVVLTEGV
jgi:hypothetical protein